VIYLDSSALLKFVRQEPGTAALGRWSTEHAESPRVSSALARVEVLRACRRLDERLVPRGLAVLAQLELVPVDAGILETAASLPGRSLRSLDAIHLASALSLDPDLQTFVTYDDRLIAAAGEAGLEVAHPV
jgi:uncharacterized protein